MNRSSQTPRTIRSCRLPLMAAPTISTSHRIPFVYVLFVLLVVLCGNPFVVEVSSSESSSSSPPPEHNLNTCLNNNEEEKDEETDPINSKNDKAYDRKIGELKPWHLPQPVVFTNFDQNTTVTIMDTNEEREVAIGRVTQINAVVRGSHQPNNNSTTTTSSGVPPKNYDTEFSVLPGVLPRSSVEDALQLLESYEFYDDDPDTVDGMPTYELFVDSPELYYDGQEGGSLKYRDSDPNFVPQRRQLRQQLQSILQPVLQNIITPYIRQQYPKACSFSAKRLCTPCYSLIRRYRHGERQSHATHHDGHAIVTVVVSLSDYNVDYRGGLYVSTGFGQHEYLALNKGDAVVHQSTLLHGVKVFDNLEGKPESTKRWSWILWYRDSTHCQDYSHEWFAECASVPQGDPLCQQLHSTKVGNLPGLSPAQVAHQVLELNQKAAQGGAGMAAVKVARAYLHQLPSSLPFSLSEAQRYFELAIASHNPDGHYGMAQLLLQQVTYEQLQRQQQQQQSTTNQAWRDERVTKAVGHLESAALMDHAYSIYNLGMVHTYGYSTGVINGTLAAEWFAASGLPEGYYLAAQQAKAVGHAKRYDYCAQRAQALGFMAPWRKRARDATGSGGAGGVSLNLPWPRAMDGRKPPEL